jgi:hypothetical protein
MEQADLSRKIRDAQLRSAKLTKSQKILLGYPTGDYVIEPLATSGDGAYQARSALELLRTDLASRCNTRKRIVAHAKANPNVLAIASIVVV